MIELIIVFEVNNCVFKVNQQKRLLLVKKQIKSNSFGQKKMQGEIQKQIRSFMAPFLQMATLSGMEFPLLQTTYSLWRKVCYHNITSKYKPQPHSQQGLIIKRTFINVSERSLLPQFYSKIQKQIDGKSVGWRKALLNAEDLKIMNSQDYQDLLFEYCEALYQLEFWIEIFYDLVSIPYTDIFKENMKYLTNEKYKATLYSKKNETFLDKACNKIGKNIVSKGFGKLTQAVFSHKLIYSITGVIGAFNPLASLASLSVSYAMESHQKFSKVQNLVAELQYLKNQTLKNINELKETYEMCLVSIGAMAQLQIHEVKQLQKEKKKFNDLISNVLQEDWLEVKSTMQGEWQLVELNSKYLIEQFDDLQMTSSSSVQDQ